METVPFTEARREMSSLVDRVMATHERVTITRNGHPAAVLISPDDLESMEETLDVLSDAATMQRLREAEVAISTGDVMDADELKAHLTSRSR